MTNDSTPHAPGNGANQAGSSFCSLKPPLTIREQRDRLQTRGLDLCGIADVDVDAFLASNNYYRVSGYWLTFFDRGADRFVEGAKLTDVMDVMAFDSSLRHLVFSMIEPLEIKFRTVFAYHMSHMQGPEAYRDPQLFRDEGAFHRSQGEIDRAIRNGRRARVPCVVHNMRKYGRLPVWALIEVLSFGAISKMYGNLDNGGLSRAVASEFHTSPTLLKSWMEYLVYIRNICAHYDRLYNRIFTKRPLFLEMDRRLFSERDDVDEERAFGTFVILGRLYERYDAERWIAFLRDVQDLTWRYPNVALPPLGFPMDWFESLVFQDVEDNSEGDRLDGEDEVEMAD
ncbi:Abi family protein [Bifidobacterium pseudolongum subsp. globosum]|uniref:Abi family protein n=1 Tax=Bifidobacterium pseudolongum TaxID=1694 RepID=UPI000BC09772|nr:Abi family protein [Bifidobacterium pseudolongum]ASW23962.1 abi-like family protein [Bifidobacterium pseudolongum]MCI1195162.1 Abi family protein [Bifidobacterium pseudolongum subsp. globosum]UNP92917.1 Abi family protein [Bifidobacterium pseudolongum subsp. globosum]UNZ09524.1 Abi family protein [Bifidobacterium pseudolongum subsp. globosum]